MSNTDGDQDLLRVLDYSELGSVLIDVGAI